MKKMKITLILSTLLIVAMLLASCGAGGDYSAFKPGDVYEKDFEIVDNYVIKEVAELATLQNSDTQGNNEYFKLYVNRPTDSVTKKVVVNIQTGAILGTFTDTAETTYEVILNAASPVFVVAKTTVATSDVAYTLYKANGEALTALNAADDYSANAYLVRAKGTTYAVDANWDLVAYEDVKEFYAFPKLNAETDDCFVYVGSDSIMAYDKETLELVYNYDVPSYVDSVGKVILPENKIILQGKITLPDDSDSYDVIYQGEKVDLVTVVADLKGGSEKSIDADYFILSSYNKYDYLVAFTGMKDKIDNIATIAVVDADSKQIDTNTANVIRVSFKGNGKIEKTFNFMEGQQGFASPIGDKLYVVDTVIGNYIVKGNGKVVQYVGNADVGGGYIISDVAVYDYDMNVVRALDAEKTYTVEMLSYNSLILHETDKSGKVTSYLYYNGTETLINDSISKQVSVLDGTGLFLVHDADYASVSVRTFANREILSFSRGFMVSWSNADNSVIMLGGTINDGSNRFYLLTNIQPEK